MGSSVKAANMPEKLRMLFVNVFRNLPYQILWKWESTGLTQNLDLPENVMLSHWFPQQDLLGNSTERFHILKCYSITHTTRYRNKTRKCEVILYTIFIGSGHPRIRAFVTHGGLLSLFETVYHGVPVVAMPVFCDHDSNVEKATQDGYAIRLEWQELTATRLMSSISTVINDPE